MVMPALSVRRTVLSSTERVWAAITDATELSDWLWPFDEGTVVTIGAEGDGYRADLLAEGLAIAVEVSDVVENTAIGMTWRDHAAEDTTRVAIGLEPLDQGTVVTVVHMGILDEDRRTAQKTFWSACLDRLDAHLQGAVVGEGG